MLMEMFWFQVLTLLILLHRSASTSNTTELIGAVGGSVTFHSHNPDRKPAAWNFGNIPIAAVIFENAPRAVFFGDKFERRVSISENGNALTLSQLSMEDAGTYTVTINGTMSTFILQVYRELPEPTVTCEAQNCSEDGSCRLSLRCSAPGAGLGKVSYTWSEGSLPWGEGPTVWVERPSQGELEPLTCMAMNPVSSRNVTVTNPRELCTESATTHPPGPEPVSGSQIGIAVGIGVAVLLFVFLLIFWKRTGWRKFHLSKSNPTNAEAAPEYSTVYAQVGPAQQRVPNGAPARNPDEDPSKTIYSLVKRPERAADGKTENAASSVLELV